MISVRELHFHIGTDFAYKILEIKGVLPHPGERIRCDYQRGDGSRHPCFVSGSGGGYGDAYRVEFEFDRAAMRLGDVKHLWGDHYAVASISWVDLDKS